MTMPGATTAPLKTLLGNYPGTRALREGALCSSQFELDFAPVKVPNEAFKRVVRDLEFDVAELAIATYLQARAAGIPLVLLPATVVGRQQHAKLVYDPARGPLKASDLAGRRVGIRAYSVTTVMWLRGVLQHDHGIDPTSVNWVTFEDPHVAEYKDPPHAKRAPAGRELMDMLQTGDLDAAIIGGAPPSGSSISPLIDKPHAAAASWSARHGAVPVNHLVAVRQSLSRDAPDVVREIYRLLKRSKSDAGLDQPDGPDYLPFGVEALRPSLEIAVEYATEQGLLSRPLKVDELFDDVTRAL